MYKKRAFISFDYDNDSTVKMYLGGQAKDPDSPFDFKDNSVKAHLSGDWEQKVQRRMDNIDVVIVLSERAVKPRPSGRGYKAQPR